MDYESRNREIIKRYDEMQSRHKSKGYTISKLCRIYNLHKSQIYNIIKG